jgi:predicted RNA-binding protein with RPS1 domain
MNDEFVHHVLLNAVLATSTDMTIFEPTVALESQDIKNENIAQFLIRQAAINAVHREELDYISRMCDDYVENLAHVLRTKEDLLVAPMLNAPSPTLDPSMLLQDEAKSPTTPGSGKRSIDTKQISQVKKELQKAYQQEALEQAKRRKKRKGYSKEVSEVLNNWYLSHLDSPYPNEDEKRELCAMCGLTLLQLNNWFSNKRIREKKKKGGPHSKASASQSDQNDSMEMPLYAPFSGQDYGNYHGLPPNYHGMSHEDITDYFK